MSITVFVGDVTHELAVKAAQFNPNAYLVDTNNWQAPFLPDATVYTSFGDVAPFEDRFYSILDRADSIVYSPPRVSWSDGKRVDPFDIKDSMQGITELMLMHFVKYKDNVSGFDISAYSTDCYTQLIDKRKRDIPQIWIAGGSDSDGFGVDPQQRYGQLIGDRLKMSVSFLTRIRASNEWLADQIMRSDIRQSDILVWGLTPEERFPFWSTSHREVAHLHAQHNILNDENSKLTITPTMIDRLLIEKQWFYQSIIHVHQVVNFCKLAKINLLIVGLAISPSLAMHLYGLPNFVYYPHADGNKPVDTGNDNAHPGPLQHQLYADFCMEHFNRLGFKTSDH